MLNWFRYHFGPRLCHPHRYDDQPTLWKYYLAWGMAYGPEEEWSGHFNGSDLVWYTTSPKWDQQWFRKNGIRPPKYIVDTRTNTLVKWGR